MEYLDGEPLDALVEREGKLALARALPILRGIAKALDAAHAKGIAHRDLKAENVFLGNDPDGGVWPKLLDFGIAKLLASDDGLKHKTRTGLPIGTPYYMSPEQCRGKDVDHRTDFYAFGVLCYRMLTGVYPFDADDAMSILMQQLNVDAHPPSTHAPELPPAIDDVVLWLLAKDPAQRPSDLRTAVRALEQAAEEAGVAIRATSTWDTQTPPPGLQTQPPRIAVPSRTNPSQLSGSGGASPAGSSGAPASASSSGAAPLMPRRSRIPMIAGVIAAALVAGGAAFFVLAPHDDPSEPAEAKPVEPAPASVPMPAPSPQPAPAPPAVATAPEAPQFVIVTVTGVPEGTEVLLGGSVIGVAPGPVQILRGDAELVLTFRADGYVPASRTVVPDADQALGVTLKKKARPARGGGKRPSRDDIIDVFGSKK
jgi:serine/threonine-protein kinase